MKEKIKLLVPFIFIGATVSCGQGGSSLRLKRETYNDKIGTATAFATAVTPLKGKQKDENGIYQIYNRGTVTSNVSYNFTADKIYAMQYPSEDDRDQPKIFIDLSNVNEKYENKKIISWDVNQNYFKVNDLQTGITYVTKDEDDIWWLCKAPLDGSAKTRRNITDTLDYFEDFRNYIFNEVTREMSVPYNKEQNIVAGRDLSGFIGVRPLSPESDPNSPIFYQNVLSPMSILNDPRGKLTISNYLDLIGIFLESIGYDFYCFNASQDITNNAYCEQIGTGNLDLVDIKKLYNSEVVQAILAYYKEKDKLITTLDECCGKVNFDFFLNYKDNFIHQEEFIADLKDVNFNFLAYQNAKSSIDFVFDCEIEKTNLNAVANQETVNTCSVDSINLDDYTVIE